MKWNHNKIQPLNISFNILNNGIIVQNLKINKKLYVIFLMIMTQLSVKLERALLNIEHFYLY